MLMHAQVLHFPIRVSILEMQCVCFYMQLFLIVDYSKLSKCVHPRLQTEWLSLVAYNGDYAIHDVTCTTLCNAPLAPFNFANEAHSHSLVDDDAPLWKVHKRPCINKFVM